MQTNYKILGDYIQPVEGRNVELEDLPLMGLSVSKNFFPTIANLVGTDMKTYKIVYRNQFTYIADTSRRGDKIAIALNDKFDKMLVSQAYTPFEVKDTNKLDPEYLMMWFRRTEFDRYARFKSHGSAREIFDWEEMCNTLLPIPHIDKQRAIVKEYNTIQNRINLNNQLIQKLEETAQAIFNSYLDNKEEKESHRLGDLIEIKGGFSYNSEDLGNGSTYLLGMGCVSFSDRFIEDGMRLYSDNVPEQHIVKPRDIIIATRQQSENMPILGCPAMIPPNLNGKKMVIASNLYRVKNKSTLNNEIIYQILKTRNYQEHIKLHTKGTTVGMITKDAIEDYVFEAPSLSFLYRIQNNINKIIDNVFLKRTETQKLTELKELLLSKLATVEN
jgi:type I restriction enzyme S subunit